MKEAQEKSRGSDFVGLVTKAEMSGHFEGVPRVFTATLEKVVEN